MNWKFINYNVLYLVLHVLLFLYITNFRKYAIETKFNLTKYDNDDRPNIGDIVIYYYGHCKIWFRAIILGIYDQNKVKYYKEHYILIINFNNHTKQYSIDYFMLSFYIISLT